MKTKYGLLLFIITSIVGGISIGLYIPFLIFHYNDPNTAVSIWNVFIEPIALQVPLAGFLALIFCLVASISCLYVHKTFSALQYRDE